MKYNHFDMLPERAFQSLGGRMTLEGGGGGSPSPSAPTQTTVQNTTIPDYAQPYVETMLGATQQQLFNTTTDDSGNVNITGVKPYVPYSTNPSDYVASFSPLQSQAQTSAANLQTPGQFGTATNLATTSGIGSLGAVGQANQLAGQSQGYGMMGAGYGAQAAQAGNQYNQMATNPNAVGAFMSPYEQNSLQAQMDLMNQQYGAQQAQEQGAATQAGAFGGGREAIANQQIALNKNLAQNQLVSQGMNTAYNNAIQNMQYGANLGLQGQQAGIQGAQAGLSGVSGAVNAGQYGLAGLGQAGTEATNLANIGQGQLAANTSIINTQAAQGAAQQQQQQNIINQAVQNYATAQQWPEEQLSFMNSMLRGLPTQTSTTSQYQATPSTLSTAAGLGTLGAGIYSAANATTGKKKGGTVKAKKKATPTAGLGALGAYKAFGKGA